MTERVQTYHYAALTREGRLAEGRLDAPSREVATEILWQRGLVPLETREASLKRDHGPWSGRITSARAPSRRDVASFTRELSTFVQSGIPLDDTLRIVAEQPAASRMRAVTNELLAAVLDGAHLSEAMARHGEAFPDEYVNMVRAGEASGDVARVLGELTDLLERRQEVAGKIFSAMVYPCVLIVMALVCVILVVGVLLPGLAPIFAESGQPTPTLVRIVLAVEGSWPIFAAVGLGLAAAALAAAAAVSRSDALRLSADRLLLRLTLAGTVSAEHDLARFARTLGSLLRAGVPLLGAMTSAAAMARNSWIRAGLTSALEMVRDGQGLGRALTDRPGISALALRMIAAGEETGKLDQMLLRIALITEQQSQRRIERLVTLLAPALTIVIAGMVGTLIFMVMNAILSINELAVR